jgi:hypothetical protein
MEGREGFLANEDVSELPAVFFLLRKGIAELPRGDNPARNKQVAQFVTFDCPGDGPEKAASQSRRRGYILFAGKGFLKHNFMYPFIAMTHESFTFAGRISCIIMLNS